MTKSAATPKTPDTADTYPPAKLRTRHDGWTGERQRVFLETLADCGVVARAATAAGMSKQSAYTLRRHPQGKGFKIMWDAALRHARQQLVDCAMTRVIEGQEKAVWHKGEEVGSITYLDNRLLMYMLTRFDKIVDPEDDGEGAAIAAQDFGAMLDHIEADAAIIANDNRAAENTADDDADSPQSEALRYLDERRPSQAWKTANDPLADDYEDYENEEEFETDGYRDEEWEEDEAGWHLDDGIPPALDELAEASEADWEAMLATLPNREARRMAKAKLKKMRKTTRKK